nr:hypothetical protein CFP56_64017 [Quercus suber]
MSDVCGGRRGSHTILPGMSGASIALQPPCVSSRCQSRARQAVDEGERRRCNGADIAWVADAMTSLQHQRSGRRRPGIKDDGCSNG